MPPAYVTFKDGAEGQAGRHRASRFLVRLCGYFPSHRIASTVLGLTVGTCAASALHNPYPRYTRTAPWHCLRGGPSPSLSGDATSPALQAVTRNLCRFPSPVLNSLGDMGGLDRVIPGQICDGAGDFEDAVIRPR